MYPRPLTCPPLSMLYKLICKIMTLLRKVVVRDLDSMVKTQAGDILETNCSPISYFSPKGLDLIAIETIQKEKKSLSYFLKVLDLDIKITTRVRMVLFKKLCTIDTIKKLRGVPTCKQILMYVKLDAVCIDFISYSKTCVQRPHKNRQKPDLNDKW